MAVSMVRDPLVPESDHQCANDYGPCYEYRGHGRPPFFASAETQAVARVPRLPSEEMQQKGIRYTARIYARLRGEFAATVTGVLRLATAFSDQRSRAKKEIVAIPASMSASW